VTQKRILRDEARAARSARAPLDLSSALEPLLATASRVASFVGQGSEPCVPPRVGWLLPVLLPDLDLDWAPYDGLLVPGRYGVLEPTTPRLGVEAIAACDVVLVPALLVDRRGYRLGKGGGSFDRALARATGLTVALVHDDELVDELPREAHDVAVKAVATPGEGLLTFA
jgi:5-formyltetrahydrofolate cyclo-ligase